MRVSPAARALVRVRSISPQGVGRLALAAAALTVGLIAYGAWVRVSASGLGCPDWPLCDDGFVPTGRAALIESGHRWFAGFVMLLLAATAVLGFFHRREYRWASRILMASAAAILVQAALGGVVVLTDLHPLVRLVHLALAMSIIGLLTLAGVALVRTDSTSRTWNPSGWHLVLAGAGVIMVGGSIVATQSTFDCSTLPFCGGGSSMGSSLHSIHRVLGVTVFLAGAIMSVRLWRRNDRGALFQVTAAVSLLIAAQIGVGVSAIALDVPGGLRILHVGLASLIWWGLVGIWSLTPQRTNRRG